jgi:hypothetical protein
MDEHIFELLETKDFAELTKSEREIVLKHMDALDYNTARMSIINTANMFDYEIDNTDSNTVLLAKIKENIKPSLLYFLINSKIQIWKVAAIFILFFISYSFFNSKLDKKKISSIQPTKTDTVYITQTEYLKNTDTIFIVKNETPQNRDRNSSQRVSKIKETQENHKDKVNLKEIYSRVALANLYSSKKHISKGISRSHEDKQILQTAFISDETCVAIDLCTMP